VVVQDSDEFKPVDYTKIYHAKDASGKHDLKKLGLAGVLLESGYSEQDEAEDEDSSPAPTAAAAAEVKEEVKEPKTSASTTEHPERCFVKKHPHQLKLNPLPYGVVNGYAFKYSCNVCKLTRFGMPSYQCAPCKYDVCLSCVKLTALPKPSLNEHIANSSKHQHPLEFCFPYESNETKSFKCGVCWNDHESVPGWHCAACNFNACIDCMTESYADSTLVRVAGGKRQVLIYESVAQKSDVPDVTSGWRPYPGVHAFSLRQKVAAHGLSGDDSKLTYFPLKAPLSATQESTLIQWLRDQHFLKIPFDTAQDFLGESSFLKKLGVNKKDDLSKMFSSELVAAGLKAACVLPKDVLAVDYSPDDLVNCPIYSKAEAVVLSTSGAPAAPVSPRSPKR